MNFSKIRAHAGALLRQHGFILPVYLGITLLFTYPTAWHLTDAIAGQGPDALQSYWNMWWVQYALATGQYPFHTPLMQHPFGLNLYFHTFNFFTNLLSLPVQACCGLAVAYNGMDVSAFVLTAMGAYGLTWYLTRERGAAFLSGVIYAFSPYMAMHFSMGQPHLIQLGWLPLYVLTLLVYIDGRRGAVLPAGILLALIGLTDWHYFVYAVIITGVVWLHAMAGRITWRERGGLTLLVMGVGGLATLFLLPVLLPMLAELQRNPYAERGLWHSRLHSADVVAFFLPGIFHPLWGDWAAAIFYGRLTSPYVPGGAVMLGYLPLILGLCGAWGFQQQRRMGVNARVLFGIVFVTFFILALGPFLRVNGWSSYESHHPVPLPYLLFVQLPLMNIHRVASRFVVGTLLALSVLAGLGVARLWQRPTVAQLPGWGRGLVLLALVLGVLFEYWPRPFAMTAIGPERVSPFYLHIANDPRDYALLEIPYLGNTSSFYQTYHKKRTMGGVISRTPLHPWFGARFFGALMQVDADWQDVGSDESAQAVQSALHCQGVRYVVFYKQEMRRVKDPDELKKIEQRLFAGTVPVYDDALLRVYENVNAQPDKPYWTLAPGEWYDSDTNAEGVRYRWAQGERGSILIYPCEAGEQREAELRFNLFGFVMPRTIRVSLNGQDVGSLSLRAESVRQVRLMLPLQVGENRVTLRSLEPASMPAMQGFEDDTRLISFNVSGVEVLGSVTRRLSTEGQDR